MSRKDIKYISIEEQKIAARKVESTIKTETRTDNRSLWRENILFNLEKLSSAKYFVEGKIFPGWE